MPCDHRKNGVLCGMKGHQRGRPVCPGAGWAVVELGRTLSSQVEKVRGPLEYTMSEGKGLKPRKEFWVEEKMEPQQHTDSP